MGGALSSGSRMCVGWGLDMGLESVMAGSHTYSDMICVRILCVDVLFVYDIVRSASASGRAVIVRTSECSPLLFR